MSYLSDLLGSSYKEGMTEEEISEALKAIDTKNADEISKMKNALSKANSEAAEFKRQLKSKLSDDEKAEQERKELEERLTKENAELKRTIALAENKAKLIGLGYSEELATETSIAMVDNDIAKIIENQSKFIEAAKKDFLKKEVSDFKKPVGNSEPKTMTKEDFRKLSVAERAKYATEHPDEYKAMYEGS